MIADLERDRRDYEAIKAGVWKRNNAGIVAYRCSHCFTRYSVEDVVLHGPDCLCGWGLLEPVRSDGKNIITHLGAVLRSGGKHR